MSRRANCAAAHVRLREGERRIRRILPPDHYSAFMTNRVLFTFLLCLAACGSSVRAQPADIELGVIDHKSPVLYLDAGALDFALAPYLDGGSMVGAEVRAGSFRDSTYYFLSGRVLRPGLRSNAVVFSLEATASGALVFSPTRGCVLECRPTPQTACADCRMEFAVPCRSGLNCPCGDEQSGCAAEVRRWKK